MSASRIVLVAPSTFGAFDPAPLRKLEQAGYTVRRNSVGRKMTEAELISALEGVTGVIAGLEPYTTAVFDHSNLKVISRCGVGMDNLDLPQAESRGIRIYATPNAPTTAVAELTVGALITLLRQVPQMDRLMHGGKWEKRSGPQLQGKTVAIVGLGRIGLQVAEYLRPFGVRLLGVDPGVGDGAAGMPVVPLARALAASDIVTIHASGRGEILGPAEFALMRRGAYVANAGRGGLINERALCAALDSGQVAGAWLDAFAEEPYFGPLGAYPQVLLTPHIGYSSDEARGRMEMEAAENLLAGLAGS